MTTNVKGKSPAIQLFCNLVIRRQDGSILLVKPGKDEERWWLPWADLEPFQHPDDAVAAALAKLEGLSISQPRLAQVQSFRGRTGWHVTFDYFVDATGEPKSDANPAWFPGDNLPRTVHGEWEKNVVRDVLAKASEKGRR
jgi:ADP-ribose pyrophosphatase YjhB (NUDIX family)